MWDLLVRVPDGLEKLRQKFEQHVKESGLDAVQKVSQGSVNAEGKAEMMVSVRGTSSAWRDVVC